MKLFPPLRRLLGIIILFFLSVMLIGITPVPLAAKSPDPEYYYNLGIKHYKDGEYIKAINAMSSSISLNPQYEAAYHSRGRIYSFRIENSDYEKGENDFKKVLELNPQNHEAYNNLAYVYMFTHRYDEAFQAVNKALELAQNAGENFGEFLDSRGNIYMKTGQTNLMCIDYSQACELGAQVSCYNYSEKCSNMENILLSIFLIFSGVFLVLLFKFEKLKFSDFN